MLCLLLVVACSLPDSAELAGTWVPIEGTPDFIDLSFGDVNDTLRLPEQPRLVLSEDGQFQAAFLPRLSYFEDVQVVSGQGTWAVTYKSGLPTVSLTFHQVDGEGGSLEFRLRISDQVNDLNLGDLKLFFYIGDPDSGRRFTFERLTMGDS